MICRSLALTIALIPLLYPHPALAQLPEPPESPKIESPRLAYTNPSPVTTPGDWPVKHVIQPQIKRYPVRAISSGNCVSALQLVGLMRQGKVTKDGFARTIPVKPIKLVPGTVAVIRTKEGPVGHVLQIKVNSEGQAISTVEGGYKNGVGRVVNPAVIQGEVNL